MQRDPAATSTAGDIERWALAELRRIVAAALKGTPVRVWLFGSRARGDARSFADVDIALDGGIDGIERHLLATVRERIEESRGPYQVDLVDLMYASDALRQAVRREGVEWIG